jgi:hypothetical protein
MAFAIQSLRFGSAFMYIQLFWPLLSLAAIALGVVAHRRIRFSGKSGRQMASSAIVLGVVALVFSLWVLSGLIFQISLYLLFR